MRLYEVGIEQPVTGNIRLDSLIGILEEERSILLGGTDYQRHWIKNGKVYKEVNESHYDGEEVREATDKETEVYDAMLVVESYIRQEKDGGVSKKTEDTVFDAEKELRKVLDRVSKLTPEEVEDINTKIRKFNDDNPDYWDKDNYGLKTILG